MIKNKGIVLLLGNGFSIDFIKTIGCTKIDLCNLFRYGDLVPWPADGIPGFLSHKHCPGLWHLGARSQMNDLEANCLIEDIITVANAFALGPKKTISPNEQLKLQYLCAYKELVRYLKHLFVYYNDLVSDDDIEKKTSNWAWHDFFKYVQANNIHVNIITYNYDIFLERCLKQWGIEYNVWLGDKSSESNIMIYKPHGSISFCCAPPSPLESFEIKYDLELATGNIDNFELKYNDLNLNYAVDALIPPAGDSERYQHAWSKVIRRQIIEIANNSNGKDEIIICGLSYWHVDRNELDAFLTKVNSATELKVINPNPNRAFTAVLSSLFPNFTSYQSSNILKEVFK